MNSYSLLKILFVVLKVTYSFTDCDGEFVFGPLCPDRKYELQIWVNKVKHVKVCSKCHREGKCLKGVDMKKCDCFIDCKDECKKDDKKDDCDKVL